MILEKLLESYPKPSNKTYRILPLLPPKVCLYGANGIGKTNAILHYAQEHFNTAKKLYIDLFDSRLHPHKDLDCLNNFLEKEKIALLILDNFTQDFNAHIVSLKIPYIMLISNLPCPLESFFNHPLLPITFLEFNTLKKLPMLECFNIYLKFGNLAEILNAQKKRVFLKSITQDSTDFWILRSLILHLGQKVSIHQIYTKLKKEGKISKDRFYTYCKILQTSNRLFFVQKFEHTLAPKKLFLWDFTLKNVLSFERNFGLLFENIVFLELKFHFKCECFYTDKLDFFLPQYALGILCVPFPQMLETKLNRLGKEREFCDSLLIITLNHKDKGENLGTPYTMLPFIDFVATNLETLH